MVVVTALNIRRAKTCTLTRSRQAHVGFDLAGSATKVGAVVIALLPKAKRAFVVQHYSVAVGHPTPRYLASSTPSSESSPAVRGLLRSYFSNLLLQQIVARIFFIGWPKMDLTGKNLFDKVREGAKVAPKVAAFFQGTGLILLQSTFRSIVVCPCYQIPNTAEKTARSRKSKQTSTCRIHVDYQDQSCLTSV